MRRGAAAGGCGQEGWRSGPEAAPCWAPGCREEYLWRGVLSGCAAMAGQGSQARQRVALWMECAGKEAEGVQAARKPELRELAGGGRTTWLP